MIIRTSKIVFLAAVILSCESQLSDDPIPFVSFTDVVINLSFPDYISLNRDGGYKDLSDQGGVRGIILYRSSSSLYFAFEKNCSYMPNEACATVDIDKSGLFMFDPCCNSSFNFKDGIPTGGPAWRPLRQYRTQLDGTVLTITDEVIN